MEIVASAIWRISLAGRLRTKWVNVHTDEVYFRDTVHGFLVGRQRYISALFWHRRPPLWSGEFIEGGGGPGGRANRGS